jgi:hypothetical protein
MKKQRVENLMTLPFEGHESMQERKHGGCDRFAALFLVVKKVDLLLIVFHNRNNTKNFKDILL